VVVIQAQMGGIVVGVVVTVILIVVVVVVVALGAVVVVAMDMEVATDQLQAIMAAQLMAPMAEVMDMAILLAMGLVMAQFMAVPCTVVHMVPMGHMEVLMEVVHMVHQVATVVQEDMVATVELEAAWVVVVVALVVGAQADTTPMENNRRLISVF
jgi:hypothetical protein